MLCGVKLSKPKERGFLSLLFFLNTDLSCCLSKTVAVGGTRSWEAAAACSEHVSHPRNAFGADEASHFPSLAVFCSHPEQLHPLRLGMPELYPRGSKPASILVADSQTALRCFSTGLITVGLAFVAVAFGW